MKLSIYYLSETLQADKAGCNDLIFQIAGKRYMIRNAKVYLPEGTPPDSDAYEFYWDDPANVQRAIDEAGEIHEID